MEKEIQKIMLVDGKMKRHLEYVVLPFREDVKDMPGALSSLPTNILLTESISAFILVKIEELGDKENLKLFLKFDEDGVLKSEHKHME